MTERTSTPAVPVVAFEGISPILRVEALDAAIHYYTRMLGFVLDWRDPTGFASVSRDRCHLMLCAGGQGRGAAWVWIGVEDAAALHAEYAARGAAIRHPPTNYPWAYEMHVEDLDGNVLRLGSEPLADHPVGEWLDMDGDTWVPTPEGGWTRAARG